MKNVSLAVLIHRVHVRVGSWTSTGLGTLRLSTIVWDITLDDSFTAWTINVQNSLFSLRGASEPQETILSTSCSFVVSLPHKCHYNFFVVVPKAVLGKHNLPHEGEQDRVGAGMPSKKIMSEQLIALLTAAHNKDRKMAFLRQIKSSASCTSWRKNH